MVHGAYIDLKQQASAQAWWDAIVQDCDRFFDTSIVFNNSLPASRLASVLIKLQMAREAVKNEPFPDHTINARHHMLNAMSIVTSGFAAALSDDWDYAAYLIDSAQVELEKFNAELDSLGVT